MKRRLAVTATLAAIAVVVIWRISPAVKRTSEDSVSVPAAKKPTFSQLGLAAVAKAPPAPPPPEQPDLGAVACRNLETEARERPFDDFFRDLQRGHYDDLITTSTCPRAGEALKAHCGTQDQRNSNDCYELAKEWRSEFLDEQTQTLPLSAIDDPTILVNKLARVLQRHDFPAAFALTARLYEILPDNPDVARLAAWGLVFDDGALTEDGKWQNIVDRLDRMRANLSEPSQSHDEFALAVYSMRAQKSDVPELADMQRAFAEAHPQSGYGTYLQASAAYRSGNLEEARRLLDKAVGLEPQRPEYQKSIEKLRDARPGDAPQEGAFSINLPVPNSL